MTYKHDDVCIDKNDVCVDKNDVGCCTSTEERKRSQGPQRKSELLHNYLVN